MNNISSKKAELELIKNLGEYTDRLTYNQRFAREVLENIKECVRKKTSVIKEKDPFSDWGMKRVKFKLEDKVAEFKQCVDEIELISAQIEGIQPGHPMAELGKRKALELNQEYERVEDKIDALLHNKSLRNNLFPTSIKSSGKKYNPMASFCGLYKPLFEKISEFIEKLIK